MAETTVQAPDGSEITVTHPEGASDEQILRFAKRQFSQSSDLPEPPRAPDFRGPNPFDPRLGILENVAQVASGAVAQPVAGLAGIGAALIPGGRTGVEAVEDVSSALTYQPRTQSGQNISQKIGQFGERLDTAATDLAGATGRPEQKIGATAVKTALLGAPAALGLRAPIRQGIANPVRETTQRAATTVSENVFKPKLNLLGADDILNRSREAFSTARVKGQGLKQNKTRSLADDIVEIKDGNTGLNLRFNDELHPKSSAIRREIINTLEKPDASFDDLLELRQLAAGAIDNTDDGFRAIRLRNKIDEFVDNLSPDDFVTGSAEAAEAIKQARQLWGQGQTIRAIEREIELAANRAGQFSGSGFENALRTQFRQLNRRIIKGQEPGIPKDSELAKAIARVSEGGALDNVFRMIGKAAPTGIVSGALGSGAGFAMGGPAGAVAVPAMGALSRQIATNRTINNANSVLDIARGQGLLNR